VLGFDESFFAKLSAIGGAIALAGMWLSAKFIVKRNIGEVLIFLTIIGTLLSLPMPSRQTKCLFYLQGRKLPPKLTSTLEQYNQTAKPMQYLLIPPFWLQR
jgi:hypothetical protein